MMAMRLDRRGFLTVSAAGAAQLLTRRTLRAADANGKLRLALLPGMHQAPNLRRAIVPAPMQTSC